MCPITQLSWGTAGIGVWQSWGGKKKARLAAKWPGMPLTEGRTMTECC